MMTNHFVDIAGPEPRDFEWSGHPWTAMEIIILIDLM